MMKTEEDDIYYSYWACWPGYGHDESRKWSTSCMRSSC